MSAGERKISYTIASREEGKKIMLANNEYFDKLIPNDLEYRMHRTRVSVAEFRAFCADQVLDFTPSEVSVLKQIMDTLEKLFKERAPSLPPQKVTFIKTTMEEEGGALAYTHKMEIYLGDIFTKESPESIMRTICHEMWHCISRYHPELRRKLYALINFKIADHDYPIPDDIKDLSLTDPDVMHHDASAIFVVKGRRLECFCAVCTTERFRDGDKEPFFSKLLPVLVATNGMGWFSFGYASNRDEVFGENTGYTIDPEECIADNFSYAICFGMAGPEGKGYPSPEIVQGILKILSS